MSMEYQFVLIEITYSITSSEASIFSIEGYAAEISVNYHEAISRWLQKTFKQLVKWESCYSK